mmetsp:Transcript_42026/g.64382  ORF Transcript_42026/g.64382 Transcript_42026/m.64382 type:complete len:153 (-) Transcript_42026:90-548(-)
MLLKYDSRFREVVSGKFKGYIHTADQVKEALNYNVAEVNVIAKKIKLPAILLIRLYDLIVFSHMEGEQTNPGVHKAFRMLIKRRLFVRCFKTYSDMFRSKQVEVEKKANPESYEETTPYIWNSSIEGDEMCRVILKTEDNVQEQLMIDVACK